MLRDSKISAQGTVWSWRVAGVLVPLAMLLLLVTTNVGWATNSLSLYSALFERHHVAEHTGITEDDLRSVGAEIQEYFRAQEGPLQVEAEVYGLRGPLFSEREAAHMADVKGLFHITWRVQGASALFLVLMVAAAALRLRRNTWVLAAQWARSSALLTLGAVISIGAVSAVAFGPLFTFFHRLGFRNDLWLLDPRTDLLVQIFPFGFWRDVTLLIGIATVVEAALLLLLAKGIALLLKRGAL